MDRTQLCSKKEEAIKHFQFEGTLTESNSYGSGHINDTFLLVYQKENGDVTRVILQRMNHEIFKQPIELMENILMVTSYLRKQIIDQKGDPERETLNVIPSLDGKPYYIDSIGCYWRAFHFIENSTSYDAVKEPEDFYQSAVAFGNFQHLLAQFPAHELCETIPDFHNTKNRFRLLKEAIDKDAFGRAATCKQEIDFALAHENIANELCDMQEKGLLPLRVTHNDTKLNNIMIDNSTGKAICVIDLDTVMPGLAVNDFGDSIRFGASTGAEDEKDLSKINCDMDLFDIYTKGFIEGCAGSLTTNEMNALPLGAITMTYECGIRFLTDYLNGDTYFKIHYDGHNLDRTRTQLKLVADMESKLQLMNDIVKKYQ